jgi:hypothetical protein
MSIPKIWNDGILEYWNNGMISDEIITNFQTPISN